MKETDGNATPDPGDVLRLRVRARALLDHGDTGNPLPEQLPRAVPPVAAGGFWIPRALLSAFVDSVLEKTRGRRLEMGSTGELSQREQQVLDALLENLANKEIGSRLNITERTVKFHLSNIFNKFGVRRRADLILLCYQERKSPVSV